MRVINGFGEMQHARKILETSSMAILTVRGSSVLGIRLWLSFCF
jgi:hypothetical protein